MADGKFVELQGLGHCMTIGVIHASDDDGIAPNTNTVMPGLEFQASRQPAGSATYI